MNKESEAKGPQIHGPDVNRRSFLGAGAAAIATAAFMNFHANAQSRTNVHGAEQDHSASRMSAGQSVDRGCRRRFRDSLRRQITAT